MEQPHVTIRDIANLCRVSTATISRALNNRPGVSAALRRDIMTHARRIGYTPDQTAKVLRSRHSNRVYFVIRSGNSDESFFQLPSQETLSMELDCTAMIHTVMMDRDLVNNLRRIESMYAPLLFVIMGPTFAPPSAFNRLHTPCLFAATDNAPAPYPRIVCDDYQGAKAIGFPHRLWAPAHRRADR